MRKERGEERGAVTAERVLFLLRATGSQGE